MKRSEMVQHLMDTAKAHRMCTPYKEEKEFWEIMLHEIEMAGMLPPPDKAEAVTDLIVYAYYGERVESDGSLDGLVIRNKLWEPEE
jgi:hypothetical protein